MKRVMRVKTSGDEIVVLSAATWRMFFFLPQLMAAITACNAKRGRVYLICSCLYRERNPREIVEAFTSV